MHNITAATDTWLKRKPDQSSNLSNDDKQFCKAGFSLDVDSFEPVEAGHWKLETADDVWYIFDVGTHGVYSHWNCSWEQDTAAENDRHTAEAEIRRAVMVQEETKPVGLNLSIDDDFDTLITPHFTYGELCKYENARRFQYDDQIATAVKLLEFLEQVRAHFGGKTLVITSGHRPEHINRAVGGATYSEHLYRAPNIGGVDFYIKDVNTYDVEDCCDAHWPYSVGYGAVKGFVHLGCGRGRVRWPY